MSNDNLGYLKKVMYKARSDRQNSKREQEKEVAQRLAKENQRRAVLQLQGAYVLAKERGDLDLAQRLQAQYKQLEAGAFLVSREKVQQLGTASPMTPEEAAKLLGIHHKGNTKSRSVYSGFTPSKTKEPKVFPYKVNQELSKLSRRVSPKWTELIIGMSSASLEGGKLVGSQGRNLIRIIEELRRKGFLGLDAAGNPIEVREQTVQVVDGKAYSFAAECGLSTRSFYRALQHPLAGHFIKRGKVIRIMDKGNAQIVATLFSVSMYEPEIPSVLDEVFWNKSVDSGEIYFIPEHDCQEDSTKRGHTLHQTQKEKSENCGKLKKDFRDSGLSAATRRMMGWINSAPMRTNLQHGINYTDTIDSLSDDFLACIDKLRNENQDAWEMSVSLALNYDDHAVRHVAAVGYYKALVHLGEKTVAKTIKNIERWINSGQKIDSVGRLLMSLLNKESKSRFGTNLRDMGLQPTWAAS